MKPLALGVAVFAFAISFPDRGFAAPETPAAAPAKPEIDAKADEVLAKAAAFYQARKTATAKISARIYRSLPGMPAEDDKEEMTFAIAQPNRLALRMDPVSAEAMTLVSDGRSVWLFSPGLKQYVVDDAPSTMELLLSDSPQVAENMAPLGILSDLFRAKPREVIMASLTSLKVAGEEEVQGAKCIRLRGEQPEMDWDAWLQTGPEPILRKFTFTPMKQLLASAPDEVKEKLKGARYEVTVAFDDWKFDAPIAEAVFAFEPPKDAKKVAEISPDEEPTAAAAEKGGGPEGLKGKPAPDFALDLLGGGKMQLAQHKGKDVVILDFWATWCGPCVMAMPGLAELAAAYKDKGVVVYAVNQQEQADAVKKFMENKKLALAVPMDAKGEAAKLYGVRGIPQTVIIGKDGTVAGVHVGYSPALKESLRKEIEALLAK